jgi:hypothetical protein|nr:FIST N-terminal domain-containing protein [Kofleriaceae bacterium]
MAAISRRVVVDGGDASELASRIASELAGPGLTIVFVFASWKLDQQVLARELQRKLPASPVVGCSADGVVGERAGTVVAVGFYGDWIRVGIGVVPELSRSPLTRSRDGVYAAAQALGTTAEALDPTRHVAVTLSDGRCPALEAFCIGSAAAAPQIQVVGGCAAVHVRQPPEQRAWVWARGEALCDAAIAVVLEVSRPFHVVRSAHSVPTEARTVVTAVSGRVVTALDGKPALERLHEMLADTALTSDNLLQYSFARYIDGTPYVRSILRADRSGLHFASAVDEGHVLRLMRPGDLIGTTKRDLAAAAERVGGKVRAMLAFSCMGRHWDARSHGLADELAAVYAAYPVAGFESYGEQIGMLLVNHTLTGLVIG